MPPRSLLRRDVSARCDSIPPLNAGQKFTVSVDGTVYDYENTRIKETRHQTPKRGGPQCRLVKSENDGLNPQSNEFHVGANYCPAWRLPDDSLPSQCIGSGARQNSHCGGPLRFYAFTRGHSRRGNAAVAAAWCWGVLFGQRFRKQ